MPSMLQLVMCIFRPVTCSHLTCSVGRLGYQKRYGVQHQSAQSFTEVVSKIGEGSFGIILKCEMLCKPGTFVTVKLVSQKTEMMRKEMEVPGN